MRWRSRMVEEDPFADEEGGEEEVSMDVDVEEEGEDDGDGYTKKIQNSLVKSDRC